MKQLTYLLFAAVFLVASFNMHAQGLRPLSLKTKMDQSQIIVEGKVISKKSFWDEEHTRIYTRNTIEVFKVFKGTTTVEMLDVITPGGTVGLEKEVVVPSLDLRINEVGVFMLTRSHSGYQPVGSIQGFIKYNLAEGTAASLFESHGNIQSELYTVLEDHTNQHFFQIKKLDTTPPKQSAKRGTISNFSPTTVSAGTKTQLTINGSGFGSEKGAVRFTSAQDGGATFRDALSSQIISWNENQIVVEVPSKAGTGMIQVASQGGATTTSSASLTVSYSVTNVESDALSSGTLMAYPTQHVGKDQNGGYIWQYFADFGADAQVVSIFERVLDKWRCDAAGINWSVGQTTATDIIANDGVNVVRFDNGDELPAGVLGRCVSHYSGCLENGGTELIWFVNEMDIVFDDGINWNFSEGAPEITQFDFETTAFLMLGEAHQLGLVIDANDVMHFAISNGQKRRMINENNAVAANVVMDRNTANAVCGQGIMTINNQLVADMSVSQDGSSIQANNAEATYQWLDCDNNFAAIPDSTNQTFVANRNGSFAVQLSEGVCVDTSACVTILTTDIIENSFADQPVIYHDATNEKITVAFDNQQNNLNVRLFSISGQLIETRNFRNTNQFELELNQANGFYLLEVVSNQQNRVVFRILK